MHPLLIYELNYQHLTLYGSMFANYEEKSEQTPFYHTLSNLNLFD